MAEPLPKQPEIKPEAHIIVDETPIYFTQPATIQGIDVPSCILQPSEKRSAAGIESSVVLIRQPSRKKGEEGEFIDKPMIHASPMDEIPWDKVSGIQWTDETGLIHKIPRENLSLTPPEESVATDIPDVSTSSDLGDVREKPQKKSYAQPRAREMLSTLTEDPNTITIVGLRAYETRALDLADRAMQKLGGPRMHERAEAVQSLFGKTKEAIQNIEHFTKNVIWKQSIGGIYFHERARQYYLDMLKSAETPFAEAAIRLAEQRANTRYQKKIADANFLSRIGTKAADAIRDTLGMRTTIQNMALEEIAVMKANGEIEGAAVFEREAAAVRARFSQDMEKAGQFVRQQLGEKLEILDAKKEEHKPLIEGIKTLITEYATGEIPDKAAFDARAKEFFDAKLKDARPDIFAEAELYSSSLFETAEMLRIKQSHEGGLANLDEAMAGMQIRLGLGMMGEVTSLEPTAVERGIGKVREIFEWLNKKNVIVPMVFNEANIGTGVALALSAANFVKTIPARIALNIGGGALAGGLFAGWREYGQLNREFLTHLREKETGAKFTETQKRRAWFERFAVTQRNAEEMMSTLQTAMDTGDYRSAMATIADIQARKTVSEVGPKRIGLIQYSSRENIESERSALDLLASKSLSDLSTVSDLSDLLAGNSLEDYMVKLTTLQTRVLREGVGVLETAEDPVHATLGIVSEYAPEAAMIKRRWPFAGRSLSETTGAKAEGLDAILEEFKKEARLEAIKYGAKAGVIGAGVGTAFHLVGDLFANTQSIEETVKTAVEPAKDIIDNVRNPALFTPGVGEHTTGDLQLSLPDTNNTVPLHSPSGSIIDYALPKELDISFDAETNTYDAVLRPGGKIPDIMIGNDLTQEKLTNALDSMGLHLVDGHKAGDVLSDMHDVVTIPAMKGPEELPLHAKLPEGFRLVHVPDHGNWQIVDTQGNAITTVTFTETGNVAGTPEQLDRITQQLHANNLDWKINDITETVKHTIPAPVDSVTAAGAPVIPEAVTFTGPDTVISGEELGNGGIWDYFLGKSHGDNTVAAANGMKNLFRMYTTEHMDSITVPEGSPHEGYIAGHLREAVYGADTVKEIDLTRIPNDAQIRVPESLFGQDGINAFNELNDKAITHLNELVKTGVADGTPIRGPGDAIQYLYESKNDTDHMHGVILKLGYLGQDDKLPTDPHDLEAVYKALGASVTHTAKEAAAGGTPGISESAAKTIEKQIGVKLHELVITPTQMTDTPAHIGTIDPHNTIDIPYSLPSEFQDIVEQAKETARLRSEWPSEGARATARMNAEQTFRMSEAPWFPIFVPYHQALERAIQPGELAAAGVRLESMLYAPFYGGESAFLSQEEQQNRTSPRLSENAAASLSQKEEIDWYLSSLSDSEKQLAEQLAAQAEAPMSPDTRAIVLLPSLSSEIPVYDRLTRYTNQKNPDNTPVAPQTAEYVVYDLTLSGMPESDVKAQVDRFKTEHPDIPVVYLSHMYDTIQGTGQIKRDLTNAVLTRIAARPQENGEIALITDNGGNKLPDTYLADAIGALDAETSLDMVAGITRLDPLAYQQFPMAFAQYRVLELMDAFVRHGESQGVPGIGTGNMAIRAKSLAAAGGYNPKAPMSEDRELAWIITNIRKTPDTVRSMPELSATIDPTESVYRLLQRTGVADTETPLQANETYKNMSWVDMAKLASEKYTPGLLSQDINMLYQTLYPSLRANDPKRFDAYMSQTLHALGIEHEITDGMISITNTDALAANMAAEIELESFAKEKAAQVIQATPKEAATSREALETMAGDSPELQVAEKPEEQIASSISSPDISPQAPQSEHLPDVSAEASANVEGIEDRVNYVLRNTKESTASVAVTTGELMEYLKTHLEMAGNTRITEGSIQVSDNAVTLTDMQAKSPVGIAHFEGKLIPDAKKGLVVDMQSIKYRLPMLMRLFEGRIKNQLSNFDQTLLMHMGQRIPKEWKAQRIDISGDKIAVKFSKAT